VENAISRNVEEPLKFVDPDPYADDFRNLINPPLLSGDTSLV